MTDDKLGAPVIALLVVIIASTALLIYLSNTLAVSFDQDFYEKHFEKRDIQSRFNQSTNLSREAATLINYLEKGEGKIDSDFYNEKEKAHLEDVRGIYRLIQNIINVAVGISIIALFLLIFMAKRFAAHMHEMQSREYFRTIISRMLISTGLTVDAIAVMFAVVAFTFSRSFIIFHKIFFSNDLWMLDPATDNLIKMFPEAFFFDVFVRIILTCFIFAAVMVVMGFVVRMGRPGLLREKQQKH